MKQSGVARHPTAPKELVDPKLLPCADASHLRTRRQFSLLLRISMTFDIQLENRLFMESSDICFRNNLIFPCWSLYSFATLSRDCGLSKIIAYTWRHIYVNEEPVDVLTIFETPCRYVPFLPCSTSQ